MPNRPKNPMLGWRPPAELSAWVRAEAARRGVDLKVILDEALEEYREHIEHMRTRVEVCERGGSVQYPDPAEDARLPLAT